MTATSTSAVASTSASPTLRFDYPGTGNSRDALDNWTECRQTIHAAADWRREHTGVERIVICGLRIGATLAAVVAEQREDVAGVVLIVPVLRGRSNVREMVTEATMGGSTLTEHGLFIHEFQLLDETVQLTNKVDLLRVDLACKVIIYSQ